MGNAWASLCLVLGTAGLAFLTDVSGPVRYFAAMYDLDHRTLYYEGTEIGAVAGNDLTILSPESVCVGTRHPTDRFQGWAHRIRVWNCPLFSERNRTTPICIRLQYRMCGEQWGALSTTFCKAWGSSCPDMTFPLQKGPVPDGLLGYRVYRVDPADEERGCVKVEADGTPRAWTEAVEAFSVSCARATALAAVADWHLVLEAQGGLLPHINFTATQRRLLRHSSRLRFAWDTAASPSAMLDYAHIVEIAVPMDRMTVRRPIRQLHLPQGQGRMGREGTSEAAPQAGR